MKAKHHTSGVDYVVAWIVLLVLTGLSFAGSGVAAGTLGVVIALTIAGIKAFVVVYIFMHLREASTASRLIAPITFIFIVLLCLGVLADVGVR